MDFTRHDCRKYRLIISGIVVMFLLKVRMCPADWENMLPRVSAAQDQVVSYRISLQAEIDFRKARGEDIQEELKGLKAAHLQELCLQDQERRLRAAIEGAKASL